MVVKAVSFALIGVINTLVDASVFFIAYRLLSSADAMPLIAGVVGLCACGTAANAVLIAANSMSWLVAVSGSYAMNSFVTFAAESGRELRLSAYGKFLASGLVGLVANTMTLVVAAQFLPVWAAKGCAILTSFVVNFSMSHFFVFRSRKPSAGDVRGGA